MDPVCPQCARPLVQRAFDKCMYCGAMLPEQLRLTEADKQANRERMRQAADADKRLLEEMRERDRQRQRQRHSGGHDTDSYDFGGCDSGDGGGDCGGD